MSGSTCLTPYNIVKLVRFLNASGWTVALVSWLFEKYLSKVKRSIRHAYCTHSCYRTCPFIKWSKKNILKGSFDLRFLLFHWNSWFLCINFVLPYPNAFLFDPDAFYFNFCIVICKLKVNQFLHINFMWNIRSIIPSHILTWPKSAIHNYTN